MQDRLTYISRWFAIVLCVALFALLPVSDCGLGLRAHCSLADRLAYPLMHASLIHCALNAWCFLALAFFYDISLWQMLWAYAIAVAMPSCLLSDVPTVGLSGVCFALMGIASLRVARRLKFYGWIAFYIAIGFLMPSVSGMVHLYCYVAGWMVGFVTTPLRIWTR